MSVLALSQNSAPGIYITESRAGTLPSEISSFNRMYMIGSASGDTIAPNTPTQITSRTDFDNQFGSSSAVVLNSLDFFFNARNAPNGIVFYTKVGIAFRSEITLGGSGDGTYTLTLNGEANSFVASGSSVQAIIDGLIAAINSNTAINTVLEAEPERADNGTATYANSRFYIRAKDPTAASFTVAATTTGDSLTAATPAKPASPDYTDYIYTLQNAFNEYDEAGFVVAPEAFYTLTKQGDRWAVGNAMEALCQREFYQWYALIDMGAPTIIDTVAKLQAERVGYTSLRGHSALFGPWLEDTDNDDVSAATAAAAVAIRRYSASGFQVPPAGTEVPLGGIARPKMRFERAERSVLNADQINIIRQFRNRGIFVYGSRTLSVLPEYRFINTRVILNVYIRTLRETLETAQILFEPTDGAGILFGRIKALADAICFRFLEGNAFYGSDPASAYRNVCDSTNNSDFNIEEGAVRLDSYVAPVTTAERIFAGVIRVPIGQVPQG